MQLNRHKFPEKVGHIPLLNLSLYRVFPLLRAHSGNVLRELRTSETVPVSLRDAKLRLEDVNMGRRARQGSCSPTQRK